MTDQEVPLDGAAADQALPALSPRDFRLLQFAASAGERRGHLHKSVHREFGITPQRYNQVLTRLLADPAIQHRYGDLVKAAAAARRSREGRPGNVALHPTVTLIWKQSGWVAEGRRGRVVVHDVGFEQLSMAMSAAATALAMVGGDPSALKRVRVELTPASAATLALVDTANRQIRALDERIGELNAELKRKECAADELRKTALRQLRQSHIPIADALHILQHGVWVSGPHSGASSSET